MTAIDPVRLERLPHLRLARGSHPYFRAGACAMEMVSWLAREPFSDHPVCASPVLGAFLRSWNDSLPSDERNALILPLIPRLVGTNGSPELEDYRSFMAADWLVRVHVPAWLRLAGMTEHAGALAELPELISEVQIYSNRALIVAARQDVSDIRGFYGDAAWGVAWGVAISAARGAASIAASDAARIFSCGALWSTIIGAAADAARDAAWFVARDAISTVASGSARDAAKARLASVRVALQQSALSLCIRMIEASDE